MMASGTIDGAAAGRRRQLRPAARAARAQQARVPTCTDPNLHRPVRQRRRRHPLRDHEALPGAQGPRPVLRLRARRTWTAPWTRSCAPATRRCRPRSRSPRRTGTTWSTRARATFDVRGQVCDRGAGYRCAGLRRARRAPEQRPDTASTPGDFKRVPSSWCNGDDAHERDRRRDRRRGRRSDAEGAVPRQRRRLRRPRARRPAAPDLATGGPNTEPYAFIVKVVAQLDQGGIDLQGEDRRNMYLHRDQDMLPGFPKHRAPGDVESSPILADLDGDNRNELVDRQLSDGFVHAYRPRRLRAARLAGAHRRAADAHRRRAHSSRARCRTTSAARSSPRPRSATWTTTARSRWSSRTWRARSTSGTTDGNRCSGARRRTPTSPASRCSRSRTCATSRPNPRREQAQPHAARLPRLAGAGRPRRQRRREARDRRRRAGPPRLRVERRRLARAGLPGAGRRPHQGARRSTRRPTPSTFNANAGRRP